MEFSKKKKLILDMISIIFLFSALFYENTLLYHFCRYHIFLISCIYYVSRWWSWNDLVYSALRLNTICEWVRQDERWPDILVLKLRESGIDINLIANPSITGYTTLDLIRYELPLIEQYHPDFITIQIGVNDYFRWVPVSEFRMRYTHILEEIKRIVPKAKILILDIPDYGKTPLWARTGDPAIIEQGIRQYNQILREVANLYSISVVDVFTSSLLVKDDPTLVASDWLHPSVDQYEIWLWEIYPAAYDVIQTIK